MNLLQIREREREGGGGGEKDAGRGKREGCIFCFVGAVKILDTGINGRGDILVCLGFKCVDEEIRQDKERSKSLDHASLVVLPGNNLKAQKSSVVCHVVFARNFGPHFAPFVHKRCCEYGRLAAGFSDIQNILWCAKEGAKNLVAGIPKTSTLNP